MCFFMIVNDENLVGIVLFIILEFSDFHKLILTKIPLMLYILTY